VKASRQRRDAHAPELFAGLCGMTFTNIQLDESVPVLERLLGRFEVDGAEERERVKIAAAYVGMVMEYSQGLPVASTSKTIIAGGGMNDLTANAAKIRSCRGRMRWTRTWKSAAMAMIGARRRSSSRDPDAEEESAAHSAYTGS
jgi:hypothetical protein